MQLEQILMDKDGREIAERGTPLFPLSVYDNDMSAFSSHFVPWHWHSECELVYVTSGKLLVETPGSKTVLELGSSAFMNANTLHAMRPGSDERCCMVTIVFDADVLGGPPSSIFQTRYVLPVLRNAGFPSCILNTGAPWEREVLDLLGKIHAIYDKGGFGLELKLRSLLSEVWLLLMTNAEIDPEKAVEPDPYIKSLLSFIHTNYAEDITLEEIAASAGVSCRTCSRSFRRELQMSVFAYVLEYRIKMAAERLALTEDPVSDICFACGFNDPSYFTRKFRQQTGLAPKEYRKAARDAALGTAP